MTGTHWSFVILWWWDKLCQC